VFLDLSKIIKYILNFTLMPVKTQDTNQIILKGFLKHGLYVFCPVRSSSIINVNHTSINFVVFLWHSRLGHASYQTVQRILKHNNIHAVNTKAFSTVFCDVFKPKCISFLYLNLIRPLEMIYTDIWGPAPMPTSNGAKYYITFLDAYFKFVWIYLLHSKSQVSSIFNLFKTFAKNQTNHKLKAIQTNNAKGFLHNSIDLLYLIVSIICVCIRTLWCHSLSFLSHLNSIKWLMLLSFEGKYQQRNKCWIIN